MEVIDVLDHGFVRLEASMADDLYVVNSARVSFATHHDEVVDADKGLINYLMRERHGTPFEHNAFMFHIKAPIFIFREWQRHRIGSFNEWSARYSKLEPEFYTPHPENVRTRVGKPGRYAYEQIDLEVGLGFSGRLVGFQSGAFDLYEHALEAGVAPEQARLFLPVSIYSQMYWTVNARSLMNFLSLRNSPMAQWEIQQYAEAIESIFSEKMPITYGAFLENNRVAP